MLAEIDIAGFLSSFFFLEYILLGKQRQDASLKECQMVKSLSVIPKLP